MIPVAEISKRLADRVLAVCSLLLPGGKITRDEYVCAGLDGGEGKSLKVHLNGGHAGEWRDWAGGDDERGDLLDLWRLRRRLSPAEAIRQAKDYLGIAEPQAMARKTYKKAPEKPTPAPSKEGRIMRYLSDERKLTPETIEAFKIAVQLPHGEVPGAIVFPCYSPSGELINRSYRSLPKAGEKKEVWQDKGCAPCLFGWNMLPESSFAQRTIILTEGQIDAMTFHQWGLPALSIPNGSGMTWIDYEFDNLAIFSNIYIAFDTDDKGKELRSKVVARLGAHRCLIVELPHKDANSCLQAGCTSKDADKWMAAAKPPQVSGIVVGSDLGKRLSADLVQKDEPFTLRFLGHDWQYKKGLWFRPGEVTAWTGIPGSGKSAFLNYLCLGLISSDVTTFICSLEMRVETTVNRMACCALATVGMQRNEENYLAWLAKFGGRIILTDIVGYIEETQLFEMMRFSFQRYGASHFVIDSLMRVAGLEENYPGQGEFLTRLKAFANETGSHIHLVAHAGKVKDRKPGLMDVKGSSLIIGNADNVVSVSRNMAKMAAEREGDLTDEQIKWHDTEVIVEKQRDSGWVGAFYLKFHSYDFTFSPCEKAKPVTQQAPRRTKNWNQTSRY